MTTYMRQIDWTNFPYLSSRLSTDGTTTWNGVSRKVFPLDVYLEFQTHVYLISNLECECECVGLNINMPISNSNQAVEANLCTTVY